MINMIRGDLTPSSGRIYLQDIDVHRNTRLAQNNLGGKYQTQDTLLCYDMT